MSFSTAGLATVAYALVKGSDGTSREINSGVKTSRISAGLYHVILPGSEDMTDTEPLQQGQGDPKTSYRKDLIHVSVAGGVPGDVPSPSTFDVDEFTKLISMRKQQDADFAIVIMRPTIPTPTDSSGAQDGPT